MGCSNCSNPDKTCYTHMDFGKDDVTRNLFSSPHRRPRALRRKAKAKAK